MHKTGHLSQKFSCLKNLVKLDSNSEVITYIFAGYYFSNCIFIKENTINTISKLYIFTSHIAKKKLLQLV